MSETTSFLGGAALAGLAAVTLLKGGVNATAPGFTSPQNFQVQPYPTAAMPSVGMPPTTAAPTLYDLEKQRVDTEQLKAQFEQQRVQTEQLKAQIQSQQTLIETLNAQNKNSGVMLTPGKAPHEQSLNSDQPSSPMMTGILWALGGMLLAFGGGLALVGIFVLLSRQQRPSRTIEVIHDEYPNYLPARRKSQVLPPRRTIKRVDADDWE